MDGYLTKEIKGAVRKIQWRTNRLTNSLLQCLKVGERETVRVEANKENNYTTIFVTPGQKYRFISFNRDRWKNSPFGTNASADGIPAGILDGCRRKQKYKMMKLVGDVYQVKNSIGSRHIAFRIGMRRNEFTIPDGATGFLTFFANDCPGSYSDNSGSIGLHIERIQ